MSETVDTFDAGDAERAASRRLAEATLGEPARECRSCDTWFPARMATCPACVRRRRAGMYLVKPIDPRCNACGAPVLAGEERCRDCEKLEAFLR